MPQINQLALVAYSQFFWLLVVLAIIYFAIGHGMVPKVQSTVDAREKQIADDLEQAQAARSAAEETEEAWRQRMDAARAEGARIANEAKQASARDTEAKVKAAAEKLTLKIESAEAKIRKARESARSEIESVAVDAAQNLVSTLTGIKIDKKDAAQAVRAEFDA